MVCFVFQAWQLRGTTNTTCSDPEAELGDRYLPLATRLIAQQLTNFSILRTFPAACDSKRPTFPVLTNCLS
ncbi:hypothetical protein MAE02_46040 [Microvirga aerophila]|uniref:Uncharacterized protein n=1 Tax=Microvirga aerophila TaxID=670291 RepID=A0A512BY80_9HYPH|nr:hypothetical protein MAE02_46040 [Microvirga aerophila]